MPIDAYQGSFYWTAIRCSMETGALLKICLTVLNISCAAILLSGCGAERGYSGPKGPAGEIAKIETHQEFGFLEQVGNFSIIAVDETPWANGRGRISGTIEPGHRRIKFFYTFSRCRSPTTGEAASIAVGVTGAVVGNILFNANVFDVPVCPTVVYGVKGIVPLDAEAGRRYIMIAKRYDDRIYVHVVDKATNMMMGQRLYYDAKRISEAN